MSGHVLVRMPPALTGVIGHGDVLQNVQPNKEGEMPATIPGTPANADEIEAIALKNMDLDTAADRQAEYEQADQTAKIAAERRNAAVVALLRNGFRTEEIAMALSLTSGRVRQIGLRGGFRVRPRQTEESSS